MKILSTCAAIALLAGASAAQAHAHLKASTPADGSTLNAMPASITLKFSEAARITALSLQPQGGGTEQKIAPLPADAAAELSVPAPKVADGKYMLMWRLVSDDGHVMSGMLHFTIDAKATPQPGKSAEMQHSHQD